jgi:hypothetical protein
MEQLVVNKIIGGLMGIKNGTKQPKDVAPWLNRLKGINEGLYEDYLVKYKKLTQGEEETV